MDQGFHITSGNVFFDNNMGKLMFSAIKNHIRGIVSAEEWIKPMIKRWGNLPSKVIYDHKVKRKPIIESKEEKLIHSLPHLFLIFFIFSNKITWSKVFAERTKNVVSPTESRSFLANLFNQQWYGPTGSNKEVIKGSSKN